MYISHQQIYEKKYFFQQLLDAIANGRGLMNAYQKNGLQKHLED